MRIAVDGRELQGKPTGVGRFLDAVLSTWKTLPEAADHEIVLLQPDGPDRGTVWEQLDLPTLAKAARADVLLCPAYTAPLRAPVPVVLVIHDVSFAAHPEWFSWREGARRRTVTRLAAAEWCVSRPKANRPGMCAQQTAVSARWRRSHIAGGSVCPRGSRSRQRGCVRGPTQITWQ